MHQTFQQIYLEITNVCNLSCSFCPKTERAANFISLADYQQLAREASKYTKRVMLHVMGEPLLHPHLAEILSLNASLGLETVVTTNGTLIERQAETLIGSDSLYQVNFSLHAMTAEPGSAEAKAYLAPIFAFVARCLVVRPDLYLNFRFWNSGQSDGAELASNGWIQQQITEYFDLLPNAFVLNPGRRQKALKGRLYFHVEQPFIWPGFNTDFDRSVGQCHGGRKQLAILCDGTVVPCCLDGQGTVNLGNALNEPLKEILASKRAIRLVRGFEEGKLVEALCQNCNYCQRFPVK